MSNTKPIGESLLQTVANITEYEDVLADISEVAIDSILEDGVIRDIPVIGSLVGLVRGGISIRDRIYAKKILRFLLEFKDIPREEIQAQIDELATNPKERQRLGEHLLLLLDRLNDMDKPALLAKAFIAFLEQRISREDFQGLAYAIDALFIDNVEGFRKLMNNYNRFPSISKSTKGMPNFLQAGLVELFFKDADVPTENGAGTRKVVQGSYYRPSPLGKLFYKEIINR